MEVMVCATGFSGNFEEKWKIEYWQYEKCFSSNDLSVL